MASVAAGSQDSVQVSGNPLYNKIKVSLEEFDRVAH